VAAPNGHTNGKARTTTGENVDTVKDDRPDSGFLAIGSCIIAAAMVIVGIWYAAGRPAETTASEAACKDFRQATVDYGKNHAGGAPTLASAVSFSNINTGSAAPQVSAAGQRLKTAVTSDTGLADLEPAINAMGDACQSFGW